MNQITNINLIENRILSAIEKYDMINSVTDVVVGLSGGADSVMLAHFIKNRLNLNVYACHINHKLRGEESQRDMNFVRQFCCDNNIILDVYEIDVNQYAKENKLTVEQAGRQIRYNCFEETRCKYNAQKIATAHTLSDNAETFLLNVSRGAGVKGLCAIPPVRKNIIRPIIFLSREQVESYCSYYNLSYVTDSTNLESVYTRNKIRHNVIPVIKQINNNFLSSINNTIDILQTENDFLDDLANKAYHIVKTEKGLDCSLLLSYHLALRRRIYMLFLQEYNLSVSMDLV
ncbi:MAG: tRNA lysidine(34) synthetase TilS, partial [Oscillospiraceae bacterium]